MGLDPTTLDPTAATRLYGLVGHPVAHSLSPRMHNAAFRAMGADSRYLAFDVLPENLPEALAGARALGIGGLNVTVPHKEAALALANEADPLATRTGAANTLCPTAGGGWRAHNTDVEGLLRALATNLEFIPAGHRCVVLGAGGAARAAAVGLATRGAQEIILTNRNGKRAEKLVGALASTLGRELLRYAPLGEALAEVGPGSLIVSATPLGLSPEGRWPWELGNLPDGVLAFDMAYRRRAETPLVEQARAAGLRAASGRSMLLYQGALASELWTGVSPPVDVMGAALDRE